MNQENFDQYLQKSVGDIVKRQRLKHDNDGYPYPNTGSVTSPQTTNSIPPIPQRERRRTEDYDGEYSTSRSSPEQEELLHPQYVPSHPGHPGQKLMGHTYHHPHVLDDDSDSTSSSNGAAHGVHMVHGHHSRIHQRSDPHVYDIVIDEEEILNEYEMNRKIDLSFGGDHRSQKSSEIESVSHIVVSVYAFKHHWRSCKGNTKKKK